MRKLLTILALVAISLAGESFGLALDEGDATRQEAVINGYLTATREQANVMRGASMQVDIDAEIPKLKKKGKLEALRKISTLGKITYNALGFSGDKSVKNEVIARYLTAETQTDASNDISITPANYKFKFKGLHDEDGQQVYVLQVSPRHKKVGLFKGEIWVDPQTYMPVRESGKFVKSPSIFLKKVEFIRTYEVRDGVAVPQHIYSRVETRIFGPVNLSIDFTNFAKDNGHDIATSAASSSIQ